MALYRDTVAAGLSGSAGGLNFAHGPGGPYLRLRGLRRNPRSPQQEKIRGWFANLGARWTETLSETQRQGWRTYAKNTPLTNRIGVVRPLSGRAIYLRGNIPRAVAGLAVQDTPPPIFGLPGFAPVAASRAHALFQILSVEYDRLAPWAREDQSAMLVYVARPQNKSVTFLTRAYRLAGMIRGNLFLPPTSPVPFDVPFAIRLGQNLFWRVTLVTADGRLSHTQHLVTEVT